MESVRRDSVVSASIDAAISEARKLFAKSDWVPLAALAPSIPVPLSGEAVPLADSVAFAFSQLSRFRSAVELMGQVFALAPSSRAAATLAYLHYASLMNEAAPVRRNDPTNERRELVERQHARKEFRRWTDAALAMDEAAIKVWYRLGVFEAKLEHGRDKRALLAFERAISLFRGMPPSEQSRRGDLRKAYHKAQYAAARSALALGSLKRARAHAFACIREDQGSDDVAPIHKLTMAGKVCLATGELEHAERALRRALDAKGPPRRDFVYDLLSDVARARGDWSAAARWIESHVPSPRRSPAQWRRLGDLALAAGDPKSAEICLKNALLRDRAGRHLTLTALGDALRALGRPREAERAYRDALAFRQRTYLSEHLPAKVALDELSLARGPSLARARERDEVEAGARRSS